ncbi:hypothetical protein C8Q80DRAFT_846268 [Daedaleopsis nitida]|nr:hypothetical protein C8Q80DRAFT_846268 [Daedaleopsis nitida]
MHRLIWIARPLRTQSLFIWSHWLTFSTAWPDSLLQMRREKDESRHIKDRRTRKIGVFPDMNGCTRRADNKHGRASRRPSTNDRVFPARGQLQGRWGDCWKRRLSRVVHDTSGADVIEV